MIKSFNSRQARTNRRTFLRAMVGGAAAVAISGRATVRAQGTNLREMKIFVGSNPSFGGIYLGQQKGFFEREGLPVEVTNFASGATAVDGFRAGRGDVVGAGDLPSLRLWQQGGIGICPLASYGDLSVIVAKNSITKPADLRQKKVGILSRVRGRHGRANLSQRVIITVQRY
jgi:NitT/TauT family transport system substrate-binding protein